MVENRSRRSRDEKKQENETKSSSLAISLLDVFSHESEQQSSLFYLFFNPFTAKCHQRQIRQKSQISFRKIFKNK